MKAVVVFFAFLFFLHFTNPVLAAAPNITAYPTATISLDTSFTITATMSGLSNNAIYRLRVAIAQSGTSNYFGSTYDGSTWHMGSIADENFISITTDGNGAWGGDIQGKIDSDDPNFTTGSGTYDLKIGRYTQTGIAATWSDPVGITIAVPPTPTPTNTPTPTSTSIPTSIPTQPPPTPTKTPTPTPTLTPKSSITPTSKLLPTSILGESTESSGIIFPTETQPQTKNNSSWFQKIFIVFGGVLLVACAILFFRFYIKNKKQDSEIL